MNHIDNGDGPPQAPKPTKVPMIPTGIIVSLVLLGALVICAFASAHSGTPAQTSTPTPTPGLTDQVIQALHDWPSADQRTVTAPSSDSVQVQLLAGGDPAGEATTVAESINIASGYQKDIWQANITGLQSVTVIVTQTDYPTDSGTTYQDIAKCVVLDATGTTLDWGSGTPKEQFQKFDVKWTLGDGPEP